MNKQNRNVAIVGAGLIGRAWAAIFARAGWNTRRPGQSNEREPYESPNVEAVIAAWPHRPEAERIAALTQRRNERLAALAAHKTKQADKS
jgi:2-polyprenyl-6-methoxyphenol hydroxylase-like FAD-dependent oxidoreductase